MTSGSVPAAAPSRAPSWVAAIVHHDAPDDLAACLASLARQTVAPARVAVWDTGASPERLAPIEAAWPGVDFRHGTNLGYAGGANRAIEAALARGPEAPRPNVEPGPRADAEQAVEWVLVLNPDVVLDDDFAERLLRSADREAEVAIATGKLLRPDRRTLDSAGIVFPRHRRPRDRGSETPDVGQFERREHVDAASGAALAIRVPAIAALEQAGELFDESFFAYHEDTDLCWRARRRGFAVLYEPAAVAVHARGWQRGRRDRVPVAIRRHSFKNHYLQLVKNETAGGLLRNLPWLVVWEGLRLGFVLLRDRALLPAYLDAAREVPGAWRRRRAGQGDGRSSGRRAGA